MKKNRFRYTCYGVDYEVCDVRKGDCDNSKGSPCSELHQRIAHGDPLAEDIGDFVKRLFDNGRSGGNDSTDQ